MDVTPIAETTALHVSAFIVYLLALNYVCRGLRNSTSWFCLFFLVLYAQNVFGYMLALIGDETFVWMKGLASTELHSQILVVAMASSLAGHFFVRRILVQQSFLNRMPGLPFSTNRIVIWLRAGAIVGAMATIVLCLSGYMGYFIRRELFVTIPGWLDTTIRLISVTQGMLLLLSATDFQSHSRLSGWTKWLVVFWTLTGVLTGFKNEVVKPMILVALAGWLTARLKTTHMVLVLLSIVAAFSIVEPLRVLKNRDSKLTVDSAISDIAEDDNFQVMELGEVVSRFLSRLDISSTGVRTLDLHRAGRLANYEQRLHEYFMLSPVMAVVPRALWTEKPLANIGEVLYIETTGRRGTSITPSVIVTTYIWSGWLGLVLVMSCWGALCTIGGQIVVNYKHATATFAPLIVYSLVLSQASDIMASAYINIMRATLLLVIAAAFGILVSEPERGLTAEE